MENKNSKVLIVDDHKLFTEGLKLILQSELNLKTFFTATTGKEAVELALKEKFEWILMDVNLPLMDGIYACGEIKRHCSNSKILFVSMFADIATIGNALKAGANAYILKGNGPDDIIEAIKEVKSGKIFLSEQLRAFFISSNPNEKQNAENYITFSKHLITEREQNVLKLICEGLTNEKIAEVLAISVRTVDTHRTNMLTKLKLPNTASLVRFAIENKFI
ncbi:MAG: response regulator transcription factor [Bacteroidetes bacterium]|jgi:DNA-binding NarL/FixJ family response regulator|nr:response regulator transcription factor [Bacteroidota bacterium]